MHHRVAVTPEPACHFHPSFSNRFLSGSEGGTRLGVGGRAEQGERWVGWGLRGWVGGGNGGGGWRRGSWRERPQGEIAEGDETEVRGVDRGGCEEEGRVEQEGGWGAPERTSTGRRQAREDRGM